MKQDLYLIIKERNTKNTTQKHIETRIRHISLTGGVGLEQVTLQKADLSELKKQWISQNKEGSFKVVCICD